MISAALYIRQFSPLAWYGYDVAPMSTALNISLTLDWSSNEYENRAVEPSESWTSAPAVMAALHAEDSSDSLSDTAACLSSSV